MNETEKPYLMRAFREKAKTAHPDAGGSTDLMTKLNRAREQALGRKGGSDV